MAQHEEHMRMLQNVVDRVGDRVDVAPDDLDKVLDILGRACLMQNMEGAGVKPEAIDKGRLTLAFLTDNMQIFFC